MISSYRNMSIRWLPGGCHMSINRPTMQFIRHFCPFLYLILLGHCSNFKLKASLCNTTFVRLSTNNALQIYERKLVCSELQGRPPARYQLAALFRVSGKKVVLPSPMRTNLRRVRKFARTTPGLGQAQHFISLGLLG